MKKENTFTLAEVLITLVIIGIIAAMTVPSLINKINNQETVSRLKKMYSTLSQATNQIITDEGPVTAWATSGNNTYELYKKKLKNAKECAGASGCFIQGSVTYLNNAKTNWGERKDLKKLVLADGSQIIFSTQWFDANCDINDLDNSGSTNVCQNIYVDINGAKKPNKLGKDVHTFVLKKTGLYPAGCDIPKCSGTPGYACTCKVLKEEAINY